MASSVKNGLSNVELIWTIPPPPLPPRVARGTDPAIPSMADLAAVARAIATEISFDRAALRLQTEACKLVKAVEAICVVFDWPRRRAWTLQGPCSHRVEELVAEVAGSGKRSLINNALLEPIGPAPTRAVLALRKGPGGTFSTTEVAMVSALVIGLAPSMERLMHQR